MDYGIEFAQWLKERNNKDRIGPIIGEVVKGGLNYKVSIMDNQLYLDTSNSILCNALKDRTEERIIELNSTSYNAKITYNNVLNIGDKVLVIANETNQNFFILDKLR
ncbi:hypothetical protein ACP49_09420 [Clostridium botulinum]|uniref:DUF2577 family protein n=1 Tax=Clostridium botulinum TaxID=1491 RepID=UPI0005F8D1FC|nr:DUF2577 family protein [Clostridium botulinum]KOM97277.1 hypothetical protein ACP53_04310 [Clostridium botulinum]KON00780.1 hypothetical protein ACP49_09420 [Clostridium botulinum]MBY7003568.1 DUF2577 family protein [Clostridium botulinum]MCR1145958.1 DUF2577 domain-containing protein [Clostridium botulinum]NFH93169.1 DUF2577 domain-containing protein [Clostridium botulinum]